jgi:hypothetical protein
MGTRLICLGPADERACVVCGCTDDDCSDCIKRTGQPCHWIAQDLCSACENVETLQAQLG